MSSYATPYAVRLAANPDWTPGSPEPETGSQDASQLSDPQLSDAIGQASAVIDSYIGARYQTPVAPSSSDADPVTYPDALIGYWCRDIALYLATLTWLRHEPMEQTDPVWLRYQAAMTQLTAVRDGKSWLNLPGATTGDAAAGVGFAGVVDSGFAGTFDASDAGYHQPGFRPGGLSIVERNGQVDAWR